MKTLKFILIITILLFAFSANAFQIKMYNDTGHKMLYDIIWMDCDRYGSIGPASMAAGEIDPGVIRDMEVDYEPGKYGVIWKQFVKGQTAKKKVSRYMLKVSFTKGILVSKPSSLIFYPGM